MGVKGGLIYLISLSPSQGERVRVRGLQSYNLLSTCRYVARSISSIKDHAGIANNGVVVKAGMVGQDHDTVGVSQQVCRQWAAVKNLTVDADVRNVGVMVNHLYLATLEQFDHLQGRGTPRVIDIFLEGHSEDNHALMPIMEAVVVQ